MESGVANNLHSGFILEGRFRVISEIGRGGYGIVYKALQISTGQNVAIKVMLTSQSVDLEVLQILDARFKREMTLIAQLKHPNIVRLIDSGRLEDGRLYTILEYIEGETLSQILDREGPLDARESRRVMMQVLDALSAAHARGVIHRDLKPDNIMLTSTGYQRNAMILDFGIAVVLEESRDKDYVTLTKQGHFQGTPCYMPPEQLQSLPPTPQTDLFAWGLVFLECLTGEIAVTGKSVAKIIFKMLNKKEIPLPPHLVGHPLGKVLKRAIAKDLDKRFKSAVQILREMDAYEMATSFELPIIRTETPHSNSGADETDQDLVEKMPFSNLQVSPGPPLAEIDEPFSPDSSPDTSPHNLIYNPPYNPSYNPPPTQAAVDFVPLAEIGAPQPTLSPADVKDEPEKGLPASGMSFHPPKSRPRPPKFPPIPSKRKASPKSEVANSPVANSPGREALPQPPTETYLSDATIIERRPSWISQLGTKKAPQQSLSGVLSDAQMFLEDRDSDLKTTKISMADANAILKNSGAFKNIHRPTLPSIPSIELKVASGLDQQKAKREQNIKKRHPREQGALRSFFSSIPVWFWVAVVVLLLFVLVTLITKAVF